MRYHAKQETAQNPVLTDPLRQRPSFYPRKGFRVAVWIQVRERGDIITAKRKVGTAVAHPTVFSLVSMVSVVSAKVQDLLPRRSPSRFGDRQRRVLLYACVSGQVMQCVILDSYEIRDSSEERGSSLERVSLSQAAENLPIAEVPSFDCTYSLNKHRDQKLFCRPPTGMCFEECKHSLRPLHRYFYSSTT